MSYTRETVQERQCKRDSAQRNSAQRDSVQRDSAQRDSAQGPIKIRVTVYFYVSCVYTITRVNPADENAETSHLAQFDIFDIANG